MIITNDLLAAGLSAKGSLSRKQCELLGVEWPLRQGWKSALIGKEISDENAQAFVSLAGKHLDEKAERQAAAKARSVGKVERKPERIAPVNWCAAPEPVDIFLYVLELEDGCYYVGLTSDLEHRFKQHNAGEGADWTKLHRPRRILHTICTGTRDAREAVKIEDAVTVTLMHQHGIEKVRGGCYAYADQSATEDVLRVHGHWQTIKQKTYDRQYFALESNWSDALDGFLRQSLAYHESGATKELTDDLFTEAYKLTRYRYWNEDFAPGLSWHFWGRKGVLPVLLSFKFGRTIGSQLAGPFDVLAAALTRGRAKGYPLRRLFLLAWQTYLPPVTPNQAITLKRLMGYLDDGTDYDRQYDPFVSILLPETRHLLRERSA
jgi:predicted GIY-YIG superfamily endonuclease